MGEDVRVLDPLFSADPSPAIRDLLLERAYGPRLSARNRAYYGLRPFIPLSLRHFLQRIARPRYVPEGWYIDASLLDAYAKEIPAGGQPIVDLWPRGHRFAVTLTHDVETADGFAEIESVARVEERLGLRSSFNLVPHKYPIDDGYVASLKSRGFEVGVHGYNHDGRAYLSRRRFERRARYVNQSAVPRFGAVGFRSPAAHRNLQWLQMLDVEYDASVFDVDPFQPMPGGTKSVWPFIAGKLVELPYTLPQDHVLFIVLAESTNRIWKQKAKWLMNLGGILCLITHPDYLRDPALMRHYEDFLEYLQTESGGWYALPREVAQWWRMRAASSVVSSGKPSVTGPAAPEAGVSHVSLQDGLLSITAPTSLPRTPSAT